MMSLSKQLKMASPHSIGMTMALVFLLMAGEAVAQAPAVDWVRLFGTTSADSINDVAADDNAIYVVGSSPRAFQGDAPLGSFDAFVARFDTAGNLQWAKQFGTDGDDEGLGVAIDPTGIYVVGRVIGTLPGQTRAGFSDAFVRKYDFNGNELWTSQFGATTTVLTFNRARKVAASGVGVYVVGITSGALPGQTNASIGVGDAFVRHYDRSGAVLWTRQFGTARIDEAFGVAADSSGVYITGNTNGAFLAQANLGAFDAFLTKYDPNGTLLFHRQYGTANDEAGMEAAVFASSVFVTGYTLGAFAGQTSAGNSDVFVRRLDSAGTEIWTRQFGSSATDEGFAIAASTEGIFVAGRTFGALPGFTNAGLTDAFIRSYDAVGNARWTFQYGTANSDSQNGVAVNSTSIFSAGTADGRALLGQPLVGLADGYILRMPLAASGQGLRVSPSLLTFRGAGGSGTATQALQIGSGTGAVSWIASSVMQNGAGWLSLSSAGGTASAAAPSRLNVDVNFGALTTGVYQGIVTIRETSGGSFLRIPVAAVVAPAGSRLERSQSSFLFTMQQGTGARTQPLRIANIGTGSLSWSIDTAALASAPWLSLSSLSGTALASRGGEALLTLTASAAGLVPGTYQALVPVSAVGAANSPQLLTVTLQIVGTTTPGLGELSPAGLVIIVPQGTASLSQPLSVGNAGGGTLTFQQGVTTTSGGNWLSVNPTGGTVSAVPVPAVVSVNPASLASGVYRGKIQAAFSAGAAQETEVLLVVVPPATPATLAPREPPRAALCASQSMELVATTIGNGVNVPVSFPRSLVAVVVDNCGEPVTNATVVANIDGLNLPMTAISAGNYSTTWTPAQASGAVTVTLNAYHPTFVQASRSYAVSTSAAANGTVLPAITPGGVVEGAGFTADRPLAPGGIISVFGSQFTASEFRATELPLPRELGGVSLAVGGENAPLYYVGPGQINAQMPYGATPGDSVSVLVRSGSALTAPQNFVVAPVQPGVFVGGAFAAVLDGQSRAITERNPARIGDTLQIFTTGLGATTPAAGTGQPAPSFSTVTNPVTVTVGDVVVPVVYQGLAPGFVGLYQVNVVLGSTVPTGSTVPLVVTQNGIDSNPNLPAVIPVVRP